MPTTGGRKKAYSNVLGVGAEFGGQVAQRKGAAGAHGCDVHICLHLPILHRHLHPLLMIRLYSDPTTWPVILLCKQDMMLRSLGSA